uniref:hypothetical protein n=1 Tax=Flavobacterium sp. TaxID=239 RepID=UPI00404AFD53
MANLDEIILEWQDAKKQLKALNCAIENDELIDHRLAFQNIKQKLGREIQVRFARVIDTELKKIINGRSKRISPKKYELLKQILKYAIKREKIYEKLKLALSDSENFFKNEKDELWVISDKYLFLINSIKTHLVHQFIEIENDAIMLEIIMSKGYNRNIDKVINGIGNMHNDDDFKITWDKLIFEIHNNALALRYPTHHLEDIY